VVTSPADSTITNFYVFKSDQWQGLRSSALQNLNRTQESVYANESETTVVEAKRISSVLFFVLFLLSAGFLWLVPKL